MCSDWKKKWGRGRTAQREALYQKSLSTTTVIKEAARAHTTWTATKVKWKHFLFAAVAPNDNKRWFRRAKWGAAGTGFLDSECPAPVFQKFNTAMRQQVTLPPRTFKARAHTPHLSAAATPGKVSPQPPRWRWRWHCLSSAPPATACCGAACSRLLNQQPLIFPPCTPPWVCPTALPPPVGAATFRRATSRCPPEGSCVQEAGWCLGKDLVCGVPKQRSLCCWEHPSPAAAVWSVPMQWQVLGSSAWAGRAEEVGVDLLSHGAVSWGFRRWL